MLNTDFWGPWLIQAINNGTVTEAQAGSCTGQDKEEGKERESLRYTTRLQAEKDFLL